jgi:hypothetical protein
MKLIDSAIAIDPEEGRAQKEKPTKQCGSRRPPMRRQAHFRLQPGIGTRVSYRGWVWNPQNGRILDGPEG